MNGVTFEYANSVKVCPVDVFWRYDLWGQPIVFAIALRKRSLDKGVLPTGVYSSSCDILIVALMLTSRHTSWGVGISLPGFCVCSLLVVWFLPTCPHSWDRWGTLSVTEAHKNLKKKKISFYSMSSTFSQRQKIVLQVRILEWVAMPSSRGSSQQRPGWNPGLYHPLNWQAGSLPLARPGEPLWSIQHCLNLRSRRKWAVCWQFLFRETDYVQCPFIGSMVTTVAVKSFNLRIRKNSHIIFFNPSHNMTLLY